MKMTTLVIHAPWARKGAPTFEDILATGVGPGYAIYNSIVSKLTIPGSTVVLLRQDKNKRRAEGVLVKLVRTPRRIPNAWRYDVHVEKWKTVDYEPVKLNRCGVAAIDC